MGRSKHPSKEIEAAVKYAEERGWRFVKCTSHAWGRIYCPRGDRDGCSMSVNSTPKNPENHAKRIRAAVDGCGHG